MNPHLENTLAKKYYTEINILYLEPYKKFIQDRSERTHMTHKRTFTDRFILYTYTLYEIYRTIVSAFLILFVPYDCANIDCSYASLFLEKPFNALALSVSAVTFLCFLTLYLIEFLRECFLQKQFIVNIHDTTGIPGIHTYHDVATITKLEFYMSAHCIDCDHPLYKNALIQNLKTKLQCYNTLVNRIALTTIGIYIINIFFSFYALRVYNDTQRAYMIAFTNIVLICPKLYSSFRLTNAKPFTTRSAYITDFVEFNDYNNANRNTIGKYLLDGRLDYLQKKSELVENSMLETSEETETDSV